MAQDADAKTGLPGPAAPVTSLRPNGSAALVILATIAVVAALHLGQEVFLPLALAILIAFALSPPVTLVRNFGLPLIASVLAVATVAFAVIGIFVLVVAGQFAELAQQLPTFQGNIVSKLGDLQASTPNNGMLARLTQMVSAINTEITSALPRDGTLSAAGAPIQVQVIDRKGAFETMLNLALPLISPIATTGIVIVLVVFMLLEREELRDRFIRLVGANDINRTTQVIEDAGTRVGTYLLMQLVVNVIYAFPIGVGLWIIGVPNALLWGLLTLVLRFVPYIGPIISAIFPMFLAFAISPGWATVLWTAALFLTVEFISSNVIEPRLYGSRTGVSSLAIIVAAIFWTSVWGPMGLVLSTPLTVCMVVIGRYLPQFAVFAVLLGDRPALAAHSRLYQRLLVGDAVESIMRAEESLEESFIAEFHRDVGLPALFLAQADHESGVLSTEQESRFCDAAFQVLQELEPIVALELQEARDPTGAPPDPVSSPPVPLPGHGFRLTTLGGRTRLDDVAARMFAQSAVVEGAEVTVLAYSDLAPDRISGIIGSGVGCVVLHFLDVAPSRASLLHVRRLKRAAPKLRVGVVIWQPMAEAGTPSPRQVTEHKKAEALEVGADFCATALDEALALAFRDEPARPLSEPARRRRSRAKVKVAA